MPEFEGERELAALASRRFLSDTFWRYALMLDLLLLEVCKRELSALSVSMLRLARGHNYTSFAKKKR